ncbi:MAG: hypothetical protein A2147_01975 [Chloroflexi bacterium RBG_16_57_8]|nr:MAG: hypothetical protein A2147_01975 [Chloroflexi bacterium RBG_16_57_8]
MAKNPTDFEQFEADLLQRPRIRKEYEALQPKYDLIRALIKRRKRLRISQAQLARMIGTQQPAISRLEAGDYNATLDTLFKVADGLGLDVCLRARRKKESREGVRS